MLNWSSRTPDYKAYNKWIHRSAITLKLLSYERSGAVLAAATTSLPETIGEVRNWDYRFCWIRDASMVVKVVSDLGHKEVARRYLQFIVDLVPDKDEKLQIMYGINREKELTEKTLDHAGEMIDAIRKEDFVGKRIADILPPTKEAFRDWELSAEGLANLLRKTKTSQRND